MKTDKKIIKYGKLASLHKKMKREGKKMVFTSGCYDLLHLGHILHFGYCKSKGDVLLVSVGNDKNVSELKGPTRPIIKESFRARHVAALECVDYVVLSEEMGIMDHDKMVALVKPDLYVVPGTDKYLKEKKKLIKSVGGKLMTCRRIPPEHLKGGISTTQIEKKLG